MKSHRDQQEEWLGKLEDTLIKMKKEGEEKYCKVTRQREGEKKSSFLSYH